MYFSKAITKCATGDKESWGRWEWLAVADVPMRSNVENEVKQNEFGGNNLMGPRWLFSASSHYLIELAEISITRQMLVKCKNYKVQNVCHCSQRKSFVRPRLLIVTLQGAVYSDFSAVLLSRWRKCGAHRHIEMCIKSLVYFKIAVLSILRLEDAHEGNKERDIM